MPWSKNANFPVKIAPKLAKRIGENSPHFESKSSDLAVLAGGAEASARHEVIHRCVVHLVVLQIEPVYVPVGGLSVAVDALRPGGVTRDLWRHFIQNRFKEAGK